MTPAPNAERLLVIMLAPIRDFVLAAGQMAQIRADNPDSHITLLTTRPFEGLAKASGYFNFVDVGGETAGMGEWVGLVSKLRAGGFRRVCDLQDSPTSRMIVTGLSPFGPQKMKPPPRSPSPPDMTWILKTAPTERAVRGAVEKRAYAILVPGASETPAERRWPPQRYAELGRLLQKRGLDVIIAGSSQDGDVARSIQHQAPGARDLTGGPDDARVALLAARAAAVIGADCGMTHLAAAAGAPTVVLYAGPADPANVAPRGHVAVLQAHDIADLPATNVAHAVQLLSPEGVRSA
jgi:ADP-heptose:LPS heptosyltransferase